jgi:hypothetical protein
MFASPEWLLLIPALAFAGWRWRLLGLHRPRRVLILLGIVALLVEPRVPGRRGGMDLRVLVDRSASTGDLADRGLPEWHALLERARPSWRDAVHYLEFAADVIPLEPGAASELPPERRGQSRTGLAISHALASQAKSRPARILVFTDGYATEPLREAAAQLAAEGIPLDYRLIQQPVAGDFRIAAFQVPGRVQSGEGFLLRVAVIGPEDGAVPVKLFRDGRAAGEATATLRDGRGTVELIDRLSMPGSYQYAAEILPAADPHAGNNRASAWVEVTGGPRVLVISRHPDDPLVAILRSQGITPDLVTEPQAATEGRLAGARAVIINNVPSFDLSPSFLRACGFFVTEQGGGLMMIGGKHAFGSGGYFQSAIDPLLPVSMELKADHRKLTVAMAIVLDRSGSMAAAAGAGVTKMDLANTGAAGAVELLGPGDFLSVHAVDSEPHLIVPMNQIGDDQAGIIRKIRSIKSMGGGIFVYKGLAAAWSQLRKTPAGTRHIILFSDAADTEEPDDYVNLLAEVTKEGCTVSVIGLGTRADVDADLLVDIAKRGGGRIQFTDRAAEIPQLFAQETMTIARKSFIEEPVGAQATGDWLEISGQPLAWLEQVDGYNLSYARPGATVALVSRDEYLAPLVATMRRGMGRTAAVTFPLAGEYSAASRAWSGYGDFTKTLARWLAGTETPPGLGLSHSLEGNRLTMNLYYSTAEWAERLAAGPPRLKLAGGGAGGDLAAVEIPWRRQAPGHYAAAVELEENDTVRGVVQAGEHTLPFGPLNVGVSAEWAFDAARLAELRAVAAGTGGRELLEMDEAWLRPPVVQVLDLRLPLALAVLLVMLYDILATRMGLEPRARALATGAGALLRRRPWRQRRRTAPVSAPAAEATPQIAPKEPETPASPPDDEARRRRFERAKRGR